MTFDLCKCKYRESLDLGSFKLLENCARVQLLLLLIASSWDYAIYRTRLSTFLFSTVQRSLRQQGEKGWGWSYQNIHKLKKKVHIRKDKVFVLYRVEQPNKMYLLVGRHHNIHTNPISTASLKIWTHFRTNIHSNCFCFSTKEARTITDRALPMTFVSHCIAMPEKAHATIHILLVDIGRV